MQNNGTVAHNQDDLLQHVTNGSMLPKPISLADHTTLIQTIADLPPLQRRDVVRQLFLADDALQQTLREEIEEHTAEAASEENHQRAKTVKHLKEELAEVQRHNTRYQQTIAQLEDQLMTARVSRARLDDDLQDLDRNKRELEREKQTTERQLTAFRERVAAIEPFERIAAIVQVSPVFIAVMDLIEVAGKNLLRAVLLYLHPRTAKDAPRELRKALTRIATLVEQCREAIATAQATPAESKEKEPLDAREEQGRAPTTSPDPGLVRGALTNDGGIAWVQPQDGQAFVSTDGS